MKNILVLAFIAIGFQLQAQIEFEKGYYIDDSGKHETLIKNIDWKNNPSEIEIKASENATSTFKSISEISEFGITNQAKYIKREVKIDYSSTNLSEISKQRNPEFETKTVLLLALIGFLFNRPHFLDLAIIYALINFVGVIAALRFVKARKASQPEQPIQ